MNAGSFVCSIQMHLRINYTSLAAVLQMGGLQQTAE